MTVPVSMDNVRLNEDTMEMEMSFYIDAKNQENPPKPNNPALYISTRPEMTVYTRYIPSKLFSRKIWVTVWKFHDFSITQILREIKFWDSI